MKNKNGNNMGYKLSLEWVASQSIYRKVFHLP